MKKILYVTATVLMVYIHCIGSRQAAEAFTTALPEIPASEEPSASFLGWQEIDGAQYYFSPETGEMQTGWLELDEKQYYFSPDTGQMQTGWKKINKQYYFFTISESEKGVLKKNCIAGTKKSGYYYVDKDGVRTDSFEINAAVQYVRSHTKAGWPADKKLSACYESLRNDYTYRHFDGVPKGAELSDCAYSLFKNSLGNCYRYASGFACIAAVLGYPAKVSTGKVTSVYGGWAENGWGRRCLTKKNGNFAISA